MFGKSGYMKLFFYLGFKSKMPSILGSQLDEQMEF